MKKNMTRYVFCISLLLCGCVVFQSPVCTIKAEEPTTPHECTSRTSVVKSFFMCKTGTVSLESLLKALNELCPNTFDKIIAQALPTNDVIAEEVIALIRTNESLLSVELQEFLHSKPNFELVASIKETQVFAELKNFVDEQPRWKIQAWPKLVDKLVNLLKDSPKTEYRALATTLSGLRESGDWSIKFGLLKHLGLLDPEIKKAGLTGLNRGLKAAREAQNTAR
jgi:hypothetical protein